MKVSCVILWLLCAAALPSFGQGTQVWQQSKFEDFEKGRATGVAIRSDGTLELAPRFKTVYTSPSTYLWAIAADKAGNVYAAAGAPARVYQIRADGASSVIFEPKELQVQSLVEREGALYAATSPDGKVYKLTPAGAAENAAAKNKKSAPVAAAEKPANADNQAAMEKQAAAWSSSIYFDPKTKYIRDLALDAPGNLYVATGDHGEIFRVTPDGQSALFFQSDEAHIRALAIDAKNNVIAGSDGSGLVYRIAPSGEAFVLYSANKKEITALAVDSAGNIYVAGDGTKQPIATPVANAAPPNPAPASVPNPPQQPPPAPPAAAPGGGSEIYKIAADGSPTLLWSSREDLVYALALRSLDGRQQLVAGTGNKGRVVSLPAAGIAISDDGSFTDLLRASANQVTGFAAAPGGGLWVCTSNLGKVLRMGPEPEHEGTLESDVFDAHLFSRWGRAEVRGHGDYELRVRSGNVDNPDRNWSPWKKAALAAHANDPIPAPPARFVQWELRLRDGNAHPKVESVELNYLTKNVPPVVDDVEVRAPGQLAANAASSKAAEASQSSGPAPAAANNPPVRAGNSVTVHWNAHDDNGDELTYSLFYRGDGESNWKPLTHDLISEKSYSFDPSLLPDGGYTIRVVASDAASHSADEALTGEKESPRFEIDTTPPRIQDLQAAVESDPGSKGAAGGPQVKLLHVTFRAVDGFSAIRRAEYSLDAGDWQLIVPVGELSDKSIENYDFSIPLGAAPTMADPPASGDCVARESRPCALSPDSSAAKINPNEHVIVIRAYDQFNNAGTAKALVK